MLARVPPGFALSQDIPGPFRRPRGPRSEAPAPRGRARRPLSGFGEIGGPEGSVPRRSPGPSPTLIWPEGGGGG